MSVMGHFFQYLIEDLSEKQKLEIFVCDLSLEALKNRFLLILNQTTRN